MSVECIQILQQFLGAMGALAKHVPSVGSMTSEIGELFGELPKVPTEEALIKNITNNISFNSIRNFSFRGLFSSAVSKIPSPLEAIKFIENLFKNLGKRAKSYFQKEFVKEFEKIKEFFSLENLKSLPGKIFHYIKDMMKNAVKSALNELARMLIKLAILTLLMLLLRKIALYLAEKSKPGETRSITFVFFLYSCCWWNIYCTPVGMVVAYREAKGAINALLNPSKVQGPKSSILVSVRDLSEQGQMKRKLKSNNPDDVTQRLINLGNMDTPIEYLILAGGGYSEGANSNINELEQKKMANNVETLKEKYETEEKNPHATQSQNQSTNVANQELKSKNMAATQGGNKPQPKQQMPGVIAPKQSLPNLTATQQRARSQSLPNASMTQARPSLSNLASVPNNVQAQANNARALASNTKSAAKQAEEKAKKSVSSSITRKLSSWF